MTRQRPKIENFGSAPPGTCDWCKQPVKFNEKKWRGLVFHPDCLKYGRKAWRERRDFPERDWREKSGGEQASPEEEKRRIRIMGKGSDHVGVDGDDEGTSGTGGDAA